MSDFSLRQQLEEIERELALRERVYPTLIMKRSMRQSVADFHMGRMRAVAVTLQKLIEQEEKIT